MNLAACIDSADQICIDGRVVRADFRGGSFVWIWDGDAPIEFDDSQDVLELNGGVAHVEDTKGEFHFIEFRTLQPMHLEDVV